MDHARARAHDAAGRQAPRDTFRRPRGLRPFRARMAQCVSGAVARRLSSLLPAGELLRDNRKSLIQSVNYMYAAHRAGVSPATSRSPIKDYQGATKTRCGRNSTMWGKFKFEKIVLSINASNIRTGTMVPYHEVR